LRAVTNATIEAPSCFEIQATRYAGGRWLCLHWRTFNVKKKTIVIIICIALPAFILFFMLARRDDSGPAVEDREDALPLDAHMTRAYHDDLPGLLEKRYIRVLTTLNRTNFFVSKGKLYGYEYALLKGYEKFLNKKKIGRNELKVVLEFIPVARDELLPKLVEGYGDIAAAGLTITPERRKKVAFSRPYLTGIDEVVVTHRGGFQPQQASDLAGRKVFVRRSSSYYESLMQLNGKLDAEGRAPVKIVEADEELETESILEMVNSGAIETTVADSHIAEAWSQVLKDLEVHDRVTLRTDSDIAWMVRKENPKLGASLNRFLKTHKQGTLLGNIYFERYYENNAFLKDPTDEENRKKLQPVKKLIKKYAQRYDFDWRLILAVAFQESGLDNTKKSEAGAVGIMQVLPSTAKDSRVNIRNVHKIENNIHAGVKYLAIIRDNYFTAEAIRPRDRVRMTLAAYNAGTAKLAEARKMAGKMGLSPNRWFRNVELAALRLIGYETVRYVSNINKYYVLYKTIL
jgi:membrane-bound lytic murein transglycosylase MltF